VAPTPVHLQLEPVGVGALMLAVNADGSWNKAIAAGSWTA